MTGGKVNTSARSLREIFVTSALNASSTSSNTAPRPKAPCTPTGTMSPCLTRPSYKLLLSNTSATSVVLEHEQHRSALGIDTFVRHHQRARERIAIVAADAEFRIVLVGEDAGDLQCLVHDLGCRFRGTDLEIVHLEGPAHRQQVIHARGRSGHRVELGGEREP